MAKISRITRRKSSKWLSIWLTAIMLINLLPASAFALTTPPSQNQIVTNGAVQSFEEGKITISKTAKQVEENLFDINLQVVTTEEVKEMAISPDSAVVLLVDVSNSMIDDIKGNSTSDVQKQRLTQAKNAASTFIDSYTKDLTPEAKRYVSVVEFGSNAKTLMGWQDAATVNGKNATQGAINDISNQFAYYQDRCEISGTHTHAKDFTKQASMYRNKFVTATKATMKSFKNCNRPGCPLDGLRHSHCTNDPNCLYVTSHYHCDQCSRTDSHSHQDICVFDGCTRTDRHYHCETPGCALTEDHWHCSFEGCTRTDKHEHDISYEGTHVYGEASQDSGGTNIAGGLRIANNLIDQLLANQPDYFQANKNVNVILLTDGAPTFLITDSDKDSKSTFLINGTSSPGNGASSNQTKCETTVAEAQQIQEKAAVQAIAYASEGTVCYKNYGKNYTIGDLLTECADQYYDAGNTEGLNKAFETIAIRMHLLAQAWTVSDPMGAHINLKSIERDNRGENVLSAGENGTISWKLRDDLTCVPKETGDITTYTYNLTYQVELDNTAVDFDFSKAYPTNGPTTLTYILSDNEGNLPEDIQGNLKSANFTVPTVKALTGKLQFNKVAAHDENNLLTGATFELLRNNDKNLPYSSNSLNGSVNFQNIASGHTYKLTETKAPDGYVANPATYTVKVEYGDIAVYKNDADNLPIGAPIIFSKITNQLDPQNINLTVEKAWKVPAGVDNYPTSVEVQLMQKIGTDEATAYGSPVQITGPSWSYEFKDVPTINAKDGKDITYTVVESDLEGYKATYSAFQKIDKTHGKLMITNTINKTSDIKVTKTWNAPTDKIPATLTVNLMNGSNIAGSIALPQDGKWEYTFTGMPTYDDSMQPIKYTVVEKTDGLTGFSDPVYDGYNIINNYNFAQDTITVSGNKNWIDGGNELATRPDSLTLTLYQNGQSTGQTVSTTAAENWGYSFGNLPRYDAKTFAPISYTVMDEATGYQCSIVGSADSQYDVTNTIAQEFVPINGEKTWGALDESANPRPNSIKLYVYANNVNTDKFVEISKVAADIPQTNEITDTPEATDQTETMQALQAAGAAGASGVAETMGALNTLNAIEDIEEKVVANINAEWAEITTFDFNAKYGAEAFPMYDQNGKKITYTVVEEKVKGFEPIYNADNFNIQNVLDGGATSVNVTKIWNDPYTDADRPIQEVTINLLDEHDATIDSIILPHEGSWTYTFADLPKYNDGKEIKYSVAEATVIDGYQAPVIAGKQANGYTITNQITPATTSITGTKTWVGAPQAIRPAITINLLQNGTQIQQITTLTATENAQVFTYAFQDLAKYDENGDLYNYTVTESDVKGYTPQIIKTEAGYDITNTFTQTDVTVSGVKNWVVPSGTTLPESITVQLYQDGGEQPLQTQNVTLKTDWKYSFTAPQFDYAGDGHEYNYTVKEVAIPGYKTAIGADNRTITNTSEQTFTSIPVVKQWVGPAADSVTVQLSRGVATTGEKEAVAQLELTADTDWQGSFDRLPVYNDQWQKYIYTIEEVTALEGYETTIEGSVITNTIKQVFAPITGVKTWQGVPADVTLPEKIMVILYADNVPSLHTFATASEDGWHYSFPEQPVYALANDGDGHKIQYTVKEADESNGVILYGNDRYTVTYDGTNITNTYKESDQYAYHIVRNYTTITDGVAGTPKQVRGETVLANKNTIVTPTPASYNTFENNQYEFVNGTPVNDQGIVTVTLDQANLDVEITLNYQRSIKAPIDPRPDIERRTITINYLEDGTEKVLAPRYTDTTVHGYDYDVTNQAALRIKDYSINRVEGDDLKGVILSNLVINVYYTSDIEIKEPDVPLGPPTEGGTDLGGKDKQDGNGAEIIILDENTPLGSLPKTGENAMSQRLALIILTSLLMVVIAVVDTRKERKTVKDNK